MSDDYGIPSTPVDVPNDSSAAQPTEPSGVPSLSPDTETAPAEPPSEFDEAERDEHGKFKKRSRARSQQATPADVPIIQELTKANREGRQRLEELAKTGSPRVQKLAREQLAIQDQLSAPAATPKAEPQPIFDLPQAPTPLPHSPEPTIEQFADHDDPYAAWQRALARWDRQQEYLQAQHQQQRQQFQQTAAQAEQYWSNVRATHAQRLQAVVQANPAAAQVLQSVRVQPPPLLDLSIMLDNNSANVALFLASHPDKLDELTLLTASQPVTQQNVEIIRRKLQQMMTAGTTGAVASSPQPMKVPRPPTPVRTGPMQTGETPPSDDESLEAHAARYGHIRLDKRNRRTG